MHNPILGIFSALKNNVSTLTATKGKYVMAAAAWLLSFLVHWKRKLFFCYLFQTAVYSITTTTQAGILCLLSGDDVTIDVISLVAYVEGSYK